MLFQIENINKVYLDKTKTNLRFFYSTQSFLFKFEFFFAEIKILNLEMLLNI